MVTGKAAHIMMVIAAWSQMDDPTKSAVVDKVEFAPTPHAPGFAVGARPRPLARRHRAERAGRPQARRGRVPALVPDQATAQIATAKAGGIPVNAAAYREPIAEERRFRWMKPLAEALPHAVNIYQFPEASEVIAILELGLNRADRRRDRRPSPPSTAWPTQIHAVMAKYGYKTGKLARCAEVQAATGGRRRSLAAPADASATPPTAGAARSTTRLLALGDLRAGARC